MALAGTLLRLTLESDCLGPVENAFQPPCPSLLVSRFNSLLRLAGLGPQQLADSSSPAPAGDRRKRDDQPQRCLKHEANGEPKHGCRQTQQCGNRQRRHPLGLCHRATVVGGQAERLRKGTKIGRENGE